MNKRILVVENREDWQNTIRTCIENSESLGPSSSVDVVDNCAQSVKKIIDTNYDLAVIDIKLPNASEGMCLVGICSNLKRPIPVLIVSGKISQEEILKSLKDYSIKPDDIFLKGQFNQQKFLNRIELLLENAEPQAPQEEPKSDTPLLSQKTTFWQALQKITFWQAITGSIAALVSVITAFSIGYNMGKDCQEQPLSKQHSSVCAKKNEVLVYAKEGNKDERVILIMGLLNQSGCIVTDMPTTNTTTSNIRYYHKADVNDAMLISEYIRTETGMNFPVKFIPNQASKIPAGKLEIWIEGK